MAGEACKLRQACTPQQQECTLAHMDGLSATGLHNQRSERPLMLRNVTNPVEFALSSPHARTPAAWDATRRCEVRGLH